MSDGNARLYYQPSGVSSLITVNLGRALSSIEDYFWTDESVAQSFSGARTCVRFTTTRWVDVLSEQIDALDYSVVQQLEAFLGHLVRYGTVSIGETSRAYGAYLRHFPVASDQAITPGPNLYANYGDGFTPTAGDILVLCGPSPDLLWEEVEVQSYASSSGIITLTAAPKLDWTTSPWVFCRSKEFWPALRLRSDADPRSLLLHGNRISMAMSLPLEVPPDAYDLLALKPTDPIIVTSSPDDNVETRIHNTGVGAPKQTRNPGKWW